MPGKPIAKCVSPPAVICALTCSVMFKCYGCECGSEVLLTTDMAMSQALALTGDLKLGWYTSIVSASVDDQTDFAASESELPL